jgi:hypothetical protein
MTIFELVKIALDELYQEGLETYGDKLDYVIKDKINILKESYTQLRNTSRNPVDYSDPATRFAYVYKYVAAHGDYIVQVLESLRRTKGGRNIFTEETLRISCIGGGPGSDFVGVLKYIDKYKESEPVQNLTCYILDREQAWADTWTEINTSLDVDVGLNTNFQPLDVLIPDSWRAQRRFLQADVFTMSYFVSEVYALDRNAEVAQFWNTLFSSAKVGARFIYIDNGHTEFTNYFDQQWTSAGLEALCVKDNERLTPNYDEQASELSEYKEKFGESPKIQAQVTYRVLYKPEPK